MMAEHPVRHDILAAVARRPGIRLAELSRSIGQCVTLTEYHARVLERRDFIVRRKEGRHVCFYPGGCDECRRGPCSFALMPGEACEHGCGCTGAPSGPEEVE